MIKLTDSEVSYKPGRMLADEFRARGYAVIEPGGHNYMLEKNR